MKPFSLALVAALTLLSIPISSRVHGADAPTEDRKPAPDRRGPPRERDLPDRPFPPRRNGPGGAEQFLNDEQRTALRTALQPHRARLREIEEKLPALRREIEETILAEKVDENAIRERARAVAEMEAERQVIRAKAFATIRASLTPEQVEDIRDHFAEMASQRRANGPGPGMRGREDFRPGEPGGRNREGADLPPPRRAPAPPPQRDP